MLDLRRTRAQQADMRPEQLHADAASGVVQHPASAADVQSGDSTVPSQRVRAGAKGEHEPRADRLAGPRGAVRVGPRGLHALPRRRRTGSNDEHVTTTDPARASRARRGSTSLTESSRRALSRPADSAPRNVPGSPKGPRPVAPGGSEFSSPRPGSGRWNKGALLRWYRLALLPLWRRTGVLFPSRGSVRVPVAGANWGSGLRQEAGHSNPFVRRRRSLIAPRWAPRGLRPCALSHGHTPR